MLVVDERRPFRFVEKYVWLMSLQTGQLFRIPLDEFEILKLSQDMSHLSLSSAPKPKPCIHSLKNAFTPRSDVW